MRKQTIYLIRHAEAAHNIKEREAVERVKAAKGSKEEQERARKAVIDDEALRDAPLSSDGRSQLLHQSTNLTVMHRVCSRNSLEHYKQQPPPENQDVGLDPPEVILVSPLRRALMTATDLFFHSKSGSGGRSPRFIALEALREKRTGFCADERSPVEVLEAEFPHVDFSDLRRSDPHAIPPKGEDNAGVRARGKAFLEGPLAHEFASYPSLAVVTHKGWLREHRKTLKEMADAGRLAVDFDIDQWDQTLYKNAEIRVAQFGWNDDQELVSVVSRSVENVIGSAVESVVKHLLDNAMTLHNKTMSSQSLQRLAVAHHPYADLDFDDDDDEDDDEDSEDDSEDESEEEDEEEDDFLFYDEEEEEQLPGPPLSPNAMVDKFSGLDMEHASPTTVIKHIALP
jgi:broad specificity phosphatase PhoE